MKIDPQGWLEQKDGDPLVQVFPTVRTCQLHAPMPLGIVWHWTAGRGAPGFSEVLARQAQTSRREIDRPAGWYFCAPSGTVSMYT